MTPLSPENFNQLFPWRKYLKQDKKTLDERNIVDEDFIPEIPNKILNKFHKYQAENGFILKTKSLKKSFSDTIHDLLKTFQNKDD